MEYSVNFGRMAGAGLKRPSSGPFRLAVLGDLSGRANSGCLATGDELAARKPLRVDVDNFDAVIQRLDLQLALPIGDDGGAVKVVLTKMDDFHPDQLYDQLEVFAKLSGLRSKLADTSTFDSAAKALQSLVGSAVVEKHRGLVRRPRSTHLPNLKTSDFAALVGRPAASEPQIPINHLIKQLIRPHVTQDTDPRQGQMLAAIDEALSDTMRRVLHDPDFQSLESVWRAIELLVRRVETDSHLQIVLYDISAEEIAADLASADDLQETGLYKLLVEQPALDAQQGALSVLVGNYTFLQTPPHADLLGRMAKLAATANAPFIASISKDCIDRTNPEDIHPMVKDAWDQLYALPEAAYLALTVPRFMLRWPYGKKTEPIDSFQFEEFTPQSGVGGMLWGNSAFLAGLLIAQTYQRDGGDALELGSILTIDDIPFYYYTDQDGDQVALPCTDRLLSTRMATHVRSQNFIPVLAIKGRNEVRLGGLHSLANQTLAGPWNAVNTTDAPKAASQSGVKSSQSRPAESDESSGNSSDDDLDAILSGLDDSPSEDSEDSESSSSDDLDLDSLLSSMGGDDEIDASDDGGLDAELAALLGDL